MGMEKKVTINKNKNKKIDNRKITMAEIKRITNYDDNFASELFEI